MDVQRINKMILYIICSFGLFYHTIQLYSNFMSGQTVVNLSIGRRHNDTIPAITICYPYALQLNKVAYYNQVADNYYKMFKKLFDHLKLNKSLIQDKFFLYELGLLQINVENAVYHNLSKVDLLDFFENYTISSEMLTIDVLIKIDNTIGVEKPIESITMFDRSVLKCFTYFSSLEERWRHFRSNYDSMSIMIGQQINWHPNALIKPMYLAIHSPNTLSSLNPDDSYIKLYPGIRYFIKYSYIQTSLLEGYATECRNYDLDYKYANFNMRSDCILHCLRNHDNLTDKIGPISYLIRKEYYLFNRSKLKRSFGNDFQYIDSCNVQCKHDCLTYYYIYNVSKNHLVNIEQYYKIDNFQATHVEICHNSVPDVEVRHLPEITFISLVCNFGGLLGLWLGFSILTMLTDMIWLTSTIINNIKSFLFINNCKIEIKVYPIVNKLQ